MIKSLLKVVRAAIRGWHSADNSIRREIVETGMIPEDLLTIPGGNELILARSNGQISKQIFQNCLRQILRKCPELKKI